MITINLCSQCGKKLAISPEGLCNICDPEALSKSLRHEAQKEENVAVVEN